MVARLASHEIFAESMMIQPHLAEAVDQKRVVYRDPVMEISIGLKMEADVVVATPSACLFTNKRSGWRRDVSQLDDIRRMIVLHDYGFTPKETGDLLGFNDGTVCNRLKEYCITYGTAPDPVSLYGVLFSYWEGKSLVDSANDNGIERGVARRFLRMGDFDTEIGKKRREWRKITPELRAQVMELKSQKLSDRKIAKIVDRYYRVVGRIVKEEIQAREDRSALIVPELLRV